MDGHALGVIVLGVIIALAVWEMLVKNLLGGLLGSTSK